MQIFHLVLRLGLSVVLVPLIVAVVNELVTTCVGWKVLVVVTLVTCDRIIVLLLVGLFLWILMTDLGNYFSTKVQGFSCGRLSLDGIMPVVMVRHTPNRWIEIGTRELVFEHT